MKRPAARTSVRAARRARRARHVAPESASRGSNPPRRVPAIFPVLAAAFLAATLAVPDAVRAQSRTPVLLVPGWFDTERDLAALRIRFLGAGWANDEVDAITFVDPAGSNRDHAHEIADAVARLQAATGSPEIDVVAHSMGGLATRWYMLRTPGHPLRRVVFIGSPHRGTLSAHLAWGGGRGEMMPDSPFLDTLNTEQPVPEGVEVMTVRTVIDTHIVPGESATLPGVADHALCCPTHAGLLRDEEVFSLVLDFLEER